MYILYPQAQQVINLFLLLILGKYFESVYLDLINIVFLLIYVLCLEYAILYMQYKKFTFFSYSPLSTGMGVVLMLATPHFYIYSFVLGLGIVQKHFLSIEKKHFFNPSNFALIMALLLFYDKAHIVLGQLGDTLGVKIGVAILAFGILLRVKRLIIPMAFVISYIFIQYIVIVQYDPILIIDDIYNRFYSVSFIVFIFFMLTDPQTTPENIWTQLGFSITLSFVSSLLDYLYGFRVQHVFMALFIISPLVPLCGLGKKNIKDSQRLVIASIVLFVLALSAIIYIEAKPPYYFEMTGMDFEVVFRGSLN